MKIKFTVAMMLGFIFFAVAEAGNATPDLASAMGEEVAVSIYVLDKDGTVPVSFNQGMTHRTPVRIASVTKTFVAVTLLRLMEEGALDINQPIERYLDPRFTQILRDDEYDTSTITVKQLMSHTSGLANHTDGDPFFSRLLKEPTHHWTREEQVQGAVNWLDPVGTPGEKFSYSDTGYVLLGHIIEVTSEMPLAAAVRHYAGLDKLDVTNTYWELVEVNEASEARRAHQFFQGQDTHGWSGTLDHYGGGGLISTTEDMAKFFAALFGGNIFKKPETLGQMLSADGLPTGSPYRLGVFERDVDGVKVYEHSGFWGTLVVHVPSQGRTMAGAVLHQKHYKAMRETILERVTAGR